MASPEFYTALFKEFKHKSFWLLVAICLVGLFVTIGICPFLYWWTELYFKDSESWILKHLAYGWIVICIVIALIFTAAIIYAVYSAIFIVKIEMSVPVPSGIVCYVRYQNNESSERVTQTPVRQSIAQRVPHSSPVSDNVSFRGSYVPPRDAQEEGSFNPQIESPQTTPSQNAPSGSHVFSPSGSSLAQSHPEDSYYQPSDQSSPPPKSSRRPTTRQAIRDQELQLRRTTRQAANPCRRNVNESRF